MPSPVESAASTFVRTWSESDPAVREAMIEACFAADGRMVTRSREIRGRAALAEEMKRILADPRLAGVRLLSPIDASGTTFRYRSAAVWQDGTTSEFFDAGEIDANGRISVLLTFAGGLPDAEPPKR
jgi:hypothetical protein